MVVAAKFELGRPLRQRGALTIYEALDLRNKRTVAIKVVRRGIAPLDRLRRDFRVGVVLSHRGILKYFDYVESDEYGGIVTEPVAALHSLSTLRPPKDGRPGAEAKTAFKTLQEALAYLHSKGIVHGNITPETVLIDQSGFAKLTEFGHCTGKGIDRRTDPANFGGTPLYASPEHLTGELAPPSDYFVFGSLFFEYVARRPLFTGEGVMEVLQQIINVNAEQLLGTCQLLSRPQRSILRSLLAKCPSERLRGWDVASALWDGV